MQYNLFIYPQRQNIKNEKTISKKDSNECILFTPLDTNLKYKVNQNNLQID